MIEEVPSDEERARVIRASVEIIHGMMYPIHVWGPLLNDENGPSTSLKLRALPIIVGCLFDIAEAPREHLLPLVKKSKNWKGFLSSNLEMLTFECRFAAEALFTLSYEEQIFLQLTRNRMVHGYLSGPTKRSHTLKVADRYGVGKVCVPTDWASELLGRKQNPSEIELMDFARLKEILAKFEGPFQSYLESTQEYSVMDVATLQEALEADHILIIKSSPLCSVVGAQTNKASQSES